MKVDELTAQLESRLPGRVARDQRVAELTTYRLGGPLAVLVRVANDDELATVADALRASTAPVLVVGRGSNLLVADAGFAGLGILLTGRFEALEIDAGSGHARAGGAVPLPVLARRTAAAGLGGLEFYVGIPGSVGGAVRMNAGGHGRETREVLQRAWVRDLGASTPTQERTAADLDLGYRHSNVTAGQVVTGAELAGEADDPERCADRIDEVVRWRREHQPGGANAGSVFRNPPGDSAGRLIDAAGLKGLRVGGATVSVKHANFFQADADASADHVHRLVQEVQRRVLDTFGVCLEPELHMVGFE